MFDPENTNVVYCIGMPVKTIRIFISSDPMTKVKPGLVSHATIYSTATNTGLTNQCFAKRQAIPIYSKRGFDI